MTACRSSRFFPVTRTWSPWIAAWTFSLASLIALTISFAFSVSIPCWIVTTCRAVPFAAGSGVP